MGGWLPYLKHWTKMTSALSSPLFGEYPHPQALPLHIVQKHFISAILSLCVTLHNTIQ
jgi:hypothetical protein